MTISIEDVEVSQLKVGDQIVYGNEMMGVDYYVVQTIDHKDTHSVINGYTNNHLTQGIAGMVPKIVQVLKLDFYQECANRWGCDRKTAKQRFLNIQFPESK